MYMFNLVCDLFNFIYLVCGLLSIYVQLTVIQFVCDLFYILVICYQFCDLSIFMCRVELFVSCVSYCLVQVEL
jgi:hypothetical protein